MSNFDFDRLLGKESMPVWSCRLENIDKKTNTNKFYEVHLEVNNSNQDKPFRVVVYYGRIGAQNPRTEIKYEVDNQSYAKKLAESVIQKKLKSRGYSLKSQS